MAWVVVVGLVVALGWSTVTTVWHVRAAVRLAQGASDAEVVALSDRGAIATLPHLLVLLGVGTAFIVWLYVAHGNVQLLRGGHQRHGRGWVIGSWFVPFLNLVRPWQLVRDLYEASRPSRPSSAGSSRLPWFMVLWWGAFTVSLAVGNLADIGAGPDFTATVASSVALAVSDGLWAVAAITGIGVVVAVTRRQADRAAELGMVAPRAVVLPAPAVASLALAVLLVGGAGLALEGPTRTLLLPGRDGVPYVAVGEESEFVSIGVLRPGDCYVEHEWDFARVAVVPCEEQHQFVVLDVVPVNRKGFDVMHEDRAWDVVFEACWQSHEAALGDGTVTDPDDLFALAPINGLEVELGDTAVCLAVSGTPTTVGA